MTAPPHRPPDPAALWDALDADQRALLTRAAASAATEGGEAYLVGGPVRDLLRGDVHLRDIDIVTTAEARQVAERFAVDESAEVAKTTDFGTATVHVRGDDGHITAIDFATARTETYPRPGALPVVTFPTSIHEDLHRRDVTINAMALPITLHGFGDLLDPTGSLTDLRNGIVRVLHDASFRDDPTRLYRAVRYAARFGFAIEPHTTGLIAAAITGGALETISRDRKRHELELGLLEPDAARCFGAFNEYSLLLATSPALVWDDWVAERVKRLIPSIDASSSRAILARMERFVPSLYPIWAFFVSRQDDTTVERLLTDVPIAPMSHPVRQLVHVWRARDFIAHAPRLSLLAPLLNRLHSPEVLALLADESAAARAAAFYERLRHIEQQDNRRSRSFGTFLKEHGVSPGPAYTAILTALRNARFDGEVETLKEAEEFVRAYAITHDLIP